MVSPFVSLVINSQCRNSNLNNYIPTFVLLPLFSDDLVHEYIEKIRDIKYDYL